MIGTDLHTIAKGVREDYLKQNFDYVAIVTGREGMGKSSLAFDLAEKVDKNFNFDKIVFYPREFRQKVDAVPKKSSVVVDEAQNFFSKLDTMTKETKKAVRKVTAARMYNLFLILCISDISDLHKYFVRHRMKNQGVSIFNVGARGQFNMYSWKDKAFQNIRNYLMANKPIYWGKMNPTAFGEFDNYGEKNPEWWKGYEERKKQSIIGGGEEEEEHISQKQIIRQLLFRKPDLQPRKVEEKTGIPSSHISAERKQMIKEGLLTNATCYKTSPKYVSTRAGKIAKTN